MTTATPAQTEKFSAAYQRLSEAAAKIQQLPEDDLDGLIEQVKVAKAAKELCESRLAAARAELDQLLGDDAPAF